MCIIAAIPAKKQLSKAILKRCWENNPHGGGFMFTNGKQVLKFKEMKSFKKYWKAFLGYRELFPLSTFVCHFRISTHGQINEDNCHPFSVNPKLAFVHNGIIRKSPFSNEFSDTYMFNETILKKLPTNFLDVEPIVSLIEAYIGSGSKLAFLNYDNTLHLINEAAGVWDNGIWYSNNGYNASNYYDMGGVNVSAKAINKLPSTQPRFSFASALIPNIMSAKKEIEVITPTTYYEGDNYVYKTYSQKCTFCDNELKSYFEKNNTFCMKCSDKYEHEWAL